MMVMDWGLQAVVIGSSSSYSANNIDFSPKLDFQESDHQYLSFSHEMKKEFFISDELEELYKPFYHVDGGQNILMGSSISLIPKEIIKEEKREEEQQQVVAPTSTYVPKYKKRKNEQKRVVLQLKADDLSSDKWAWRKYGQKPIKGSPYPRSYYRCSSSKGCLARKQVEQSCTENGTFIVTYTAEHNHSQPTRRNSLAGTIKSKFPNSKNTNIKKNIVKDEKISSPHGSTSNNNLGFSPETLMIDEFQEIEMNDHEEIKNMFEGSDENECVSIQEMFDGDFFAGLEDIHDGFTSSFGCNNSTSPFSF
ncbi:probable WRKY transcription factor 29 isoform X1 [Solanum pennellii]|uniref:Probable WRKY transcription factor 29 isoform X1 n=1 Tax=Solanum pennellii TaxID=28526 RepID=A0ABM1HF25_SOLPN|nr:probable WRKY transcription factor 29 isoform X1 [Solanum pennellii]